MTSKSTRKLILVDRSLFIAIFALLVFGLVMIFNSTSVQSQQIYKDAYRFVFLQTGWIVIGLVCFFFFYNFDYQKLEKLSYLFYLVSLAFLVFLAIVSFLPCEASLSISPCINGANRWFYFNPPPLPKVPFLGIIGFQPGEFAKLSLILYLAVQLSKNVKAKGNTFLVYVVASAIFSFLILLQPNMSTAILVFMIGTVMYFASGASLKPLFVLVPILVLCVLIFIFSSPYRAARLSTYLTGDTNIDSSRNYHMRQISIALGSGGLFGVGFGESKQKYQYLPEVASDSIFAIIGEELGFLGTTAVVLVFAFLVYKGITISKNSADLIGKLLALGITSWIGMQFVINAAAMARLLPLTGVPMPLISYGGSSMVFSLIGLGILSNIDKENRKIKLKE